MRLENPANVFALGEVGGGVLCWESQVFGQVRRGTNEAYQQWQNRKCKAHFKVSGLLSQDVFLQLQTGSIKEKVSITSNDPRVFSLWLSDTGLIHLYQTLKANANSPVGFPSLVPTGGSS